VAHIGKRWGRGNPKTPKTPSHTNFLMGRWNMKTNSHTNFLMGGRNPNPKGWGEYQDPLILNHQMGGWNIKTPSHTKPPDKSLLVVGGGDAQHTHT